MSKDIGQDILKNGLSVNHLIEYVENSETVKAAIAEAVHRFYFDYCFNPYTERPYEGEAFKTISDIHSTIWCEMPDWRQRLRNSVQRYAEPGLSDRCLTVVKPRAVVPMKIKVAMDETQLTNK